MPIPIDKWDKEQIKKLAQISGKPLEVQCSEAFLRAAWRVRLGTFYTDMASERIRELDFLAEKTTSFEAENVNRDLIQWHLRFRVLGSCKGFAQEHGPATYSVATGNASVEKPNFICYECGIHGRHVADTMKHYVAQRFLHEPPNSITRQIVGFDVFQCKEDVKNSASAEYSRKTDRDLYEGLDSAVKAALFWQREDYLRTKRQLGSDNQAQITINIPLLILSQPFWDVAIDQGTPCEPRLQTSGFHVSLYPSGDREKPPEPIMSIVWEAARLEELTNRLYRVFDYFMFETEAAVKKR